MRSLASKFLILLIRVYQYAISPVLGPHCRFYPTCSHYAIESLKQHGLARGGYLSVRRCLKCHPWHPGGVDPVPPNKRHSPTEQRTNLEKL